jgi:hypothetical protein
MGCPKAGRAPRSAIWLVWLALLSALDAGCVGGAPSAGVAHIGTTTASTSLAGPSVTSVSGLRSAQLAFAHCMRSHGVPAYPDPGSEGGLAASKEGASGQLDVNSSQFRDGLGHCRRLLPTGAPASPVQQAAVTAHAVKFARCMRAHGVPGFPDPGVSPGGGKLPGPGYFVQAQSGPLSPDNPQFVKAQKSCRALTGGLY